MLNATDIARAANDTSCQNSELVPPCVKIIQIHLDPSKAVNKTLSVECILLSCCFFFSIYAVVIFTYRAVCEDKVNAQV